MVINKVHKERSFNLSELLRTGLEQPYNSSFVLLRRKKKKLFQRAVLQAE